MSWSPRNCRARRRWREPLTGPPDRKDRAGHPRHRSGSGLCRIVGRHAHAASNAAALFPVFDEPEVRLKKGLTAAVITGDLRKRLSALEGAFIMVIPPPSIPGIGTGGGFTMRIQDRRAAAPNCWRRRPMNWWRRRARRRD